jgi:threonine dehydrogenase-like Zn-dependent dehydrogenase
MRVLALVAPRTFAEIDIADPNPAPDDVVIRVEMVSICGSDLTGYLGNHPRIRPPTVLGHELSGVVEWAGSTVSLLAVGDRVAVDPTSGCGTCRYCRAGRHNICLGYLVMGESTAHPGGMAGRVAVRQDRAFRLPEGVSFAAGAIAQPLSVATHAVRDRAAVRSGETVLIIGAGPIGLGILLAARAAGARTIISDPLRARLDTAYALGADIVVQPGEEDLAAAVREATGGSGADATFEAVGGSGDALLQQAFELTCRGGRIVVVGLKIPEARIPLDELKWGEKILMGSQAHPDTMPEVVARIASGAYPADLMVTHRFAWDHADEAFALLADRTPGVVKIVLHPPNR